MPQFSLVMSKVSTYADLQNPLQKLNQVLYLDAHILDICATLEDLLQVGHPHSYLFIDC